MVKLIPHLKRYPERKRELLQAWDSADELLLSHLRSRDLKSERILILNDQFGALSTGLFGIPELTTYTDSFLSAQAIQNNSEGKLRPISSLGQITGEFDFVVARIPKNLSFFEEELRRVSQHLKPGGQVICTSMVKHLPKGAFDLLERFIGPTHTSLAEKKARLIFASLVKPKSELLGPIEIRVENFSHTFSNLPNVFSREKLDIGSRFFLDHLPHLPKGKVLDLGCGNGLIGIAMKRKNPDVEIWFSDESKEAIESARINYQKYFKDESQLFWTNGFENQAPESVDLVLCNPPFHQAHVVGDQIALEMFQDAKHALRIGGVLRVIGNSHLAYGVKLKKLFGNSELVAQNSKFMIFDCVKS